MPTVVSCSCGKKLNVRDELVGKKVKCPACGGVLTVAVEVSAADVVDDDEAPPARKPAPPGKPPPVPAGPSPSAPAPSGKGPPPRAKETRANEDDDQPAAREDLGIFRCTGSGQSRLLCMNDEGAFFADVDKKTMKRVEADLAEGESPQDAFDEPAFIPWGAVTKIDSNLKHHDFQITFKQGSDEDTSQTFRFEDKRDRTDALKWMRDHLAPEFTYKRRELSRLQATFSPLITIGIMILVFGFLVWLSYALQHEGGRVRGLGGIIIAYTVGWLGPMWTGVLGGVCILGCIAWMGVRIADPPIEVTITPQADKKKKRDEEDEEDEEEEEEERPRAKGKRKRPRDED